MKKELSYQVYILVLKVIIYSDPVIKGSKEVCQALIYNKKYERAGHLWQGRYKLLRSI